MNSFSVRRKYTTWIYAAAVILDYSFSSEYSRPKSGRVNPMLSHAPPERYILFRLIHFVGFTRVPYTHTSAAEHVLYAAVSYTKVNRVLKVKCEINSCEIKCFWRIPRRRLTSNFSLFLFRNKVSRSQRIYTL